MSNAAANFYYRSYCDRDVTGYTLAGDFSNPANAVDRDPSSFAITSGKNTDGVAALFTVDLLWGRNIDTIMLQSNFAAFTIKYWNGSSFVDFATPVNVSGNTSAFLLLSLGALYNTQKIQITATSTIIANSEKVITEMAITRLFNSMIVSALEGAAVNHVRTTTKNIKGASVQILQFPQWDVFAAKLKFKNMIGSRWDNYWAVKNQFKIDALYIYLYYTDSPNLIDTFGPSAFYLVNDEAQVGTQPSAEVLMAGVDGDIDARQV